MYQDNLVLLSHPVLELAPLPKTPGSSRWRMVFKNLDLGNCYAWVKGSILVFFLLILVAPSTMERLLLLLPFTSLCLCLALCKEPLSCGCCCPHFWAWHWASPYSTCFMGIWRTHWHRAPCLDGPMLNTCFLEILNFLLVGTGGWTRAFRLLGWCYILEPHPCPRTTILLALPPK
jgi:hypothetical protein